ncbi:hypothetical protein PSYAR_29121, partial [Pseudomonas syringae pv. aceris str. M302273]
GKCALGCSLFDEAAEQVVGKFQFFGGDVQFSAGVRRLALE